MTLLLWSCYYFMFVEIFNGALNAVSAATDLVKIKIVNYKV